MRKAVVTILTILFSGEALATSGASSATSFQTISLLSSILSPFAASLLIAVYYSKLEDYSSYLGALSALISFTITFSLLGSSFVVSLPWIPSLGIYFEFLVDGLSLMMASLASGIGILIFIYSRIYMDHGNWKRKYYATLTVFMGSMIGLVFASNLILLFLFWEFTSICSFLLISHSQRTKSGIEASKKSLLLTVGSGLMLLIGFLTISSVAGTFSMVELLDSGSLLSSLEIEGLYLPVLGFLVVGAGAKSAQLPLHIWLPDAMEAPTPVSAFLHSATMVKAGVYLLARFRPLIQSDIWSLVLLTIGLGTMTIAAILAFGSSDLKELLAYSTASHLGLIVAGLGFNSVLGAETSVFHLLNHAIFKASLFMTAGIVLHEAGTQKIRELSGLRKDWPLLGIVATLAGMSMAGVPPMNGFYSKELLFEAAWHLASHNGGLLWFIPALAVSGSVFTFLYSIRFVSVFYGKKQGSTQPIPKLMVLPPALLAFSAVLIGFMPNFIANSVLNPALSQISQHSHHMSIHLPTKPKPALLMSILTFATGLGIYSNANSLMNSIENNIHRLISVNRIYSFLLDFLNELSDNLVYTVESGLLRTYASWILAISSLAGIGGLLVAEIASLPAVSIVFPVLVVLSTAVASVYAVLRSESYISSVLTLSILGFMVSIYYLLMQAPDLAMTQMLVETLSLIIFLLVLNKLPSFDKSVSFGRKSRDIVLASFSGLLVTLSVIYARMEETPGEVANYYLNNAISGSGGGNVVNVILVDFRGLDTLGEISVIIMAGLSVYMLFGMKGGEE